MYLSWTLSLGYLAYLKLTCILQSRLVDIRGKWVYGTLFEKYWSVGNAQKVEYIFKQMKVDSFLKGLNNISLMDFAFKVETHPLIDTLQTYRGFPIVHEPFNECQASILIY